MQDISVNNQVEWPSQWLNSFPTLSTINPALNVNSSDKICCKFGNEVQEYSAMNAWHGIRSRDVEVSWGKLVWSAYCIPKHAFLMWLVMRGNL